MTNKGQIRTHRLIDGLIDRAHTNWPGAPCLLHLPTGEEFFVSQHTARQSYCSDLHAGYFQHLIHPYCEVDPTPHNRGVCEIHPLTEVGIGSTHPAYLVDIHSGICAFTEEPPAGTDGNR